MAETRPQRTVLSSQAGYRWVQIMSEKNSGRPQRTESNNEYRRSKQSIESRIRVRVRLSRRECRRIIAESITPTRLRTFITREARAEQGPSGHTHRHTHRRVFAAWGGVWNTYICVQTALNKRQRRRTMNAFSAVELEQLGQLSSAQIGHSRTVLIGAHIVFCQL